MDQFNAIFQHFPQYRIVICSECRKGVVQSQFRAHLNGSHTTLLAKTRQEIVSAASDIHRWAQSENEVVIPEAVPHPVPHIAIFNDGFKCTQCGYIRRTLKNIQDHCRGTHGWNNNRKRGRPPSGNHQITVSKMWAEGVHCQKFAHAGKLGRLFEVRPQERVDGDDDNDESIVKRQLEAAFQETTTALDQADKDAHARIEPDDDRHVTHAWLNRAGWARHLAGLDREWLLELVQKPRKEERALTRVCWAVEMVIWKAQQASCTSVVGFPAMNYINRRELGNDSNEKPFNARQTAKTMIKYTGCWLAIIRYI